MPECLLILQGKTGELSAFDTLYRAKSCLSGSRYPKAACLAFVTMKIVAKKEKAKWEDLITGVRLAKQGWW